KPSPQNHELAYSSRYCVRETVLCETAARRDEHTQRVHHSAWRQFFDYRIGIRPEDQLCKRVLKYSAFIALLMYCSVRSGAQRCPTGLLMKHVGHLQSGFISVA